MYNQFLEIEQKLAAVTTETHIVTTNGDTTSGENRLDSTLQSMKEHMLARNEALQISLVTRPEAGYRAPSVAIMKKML